MLLSLLLALLLSGPIHSYPSLGHEEERGTLTGRVIDSESHDPLPGAAVRLREIGRARVTDPNGNFRFEDVPIRRLTIAVQFLGYAPEERQVVPIADETYDVTIELEPSVLELQDVVVTGTGRERGVADTYQPTVVMSGAELQRNLATSLAASIDRLPGLAQQYNGPIAAQPVIRGLSGDRVLVLEDGLRTGDLSTTASDHAVAADPLTAERIEVVRGPAGLLYGSNALGGVINVVRQDVPRNLPRSITGTLSGTAESVNRGAGGSFNMNIPVGTFALRTELGGRVAGDTRTPVGTLESTGVDAWNGGAGISWIRPWAFIGVAGRYQELRYGLPGEFQGQIIPGGHEGGVDADTRRKSLQIRAAHLDLPGFYNTLEFDAHLNHYIHDEIEGTTSSGVPIIGAHFDQLSGGANLGLRHEHDLHGHTDRSIRAEGAVGIAFYAGDLVTRGSYVGTRPATEFSIAGFGYEEFSADRLRFQLGLRYDWRRVTPNETRPIRVGSREIPVRQRDFRAISGSAALLFDLSDAWTVGINLARAFRTPAIEELYSDGPHLADFSFDIGNPELESEIGHGADVFVRSSMRKLQFEAGAFVNRISNYIYYRPTGALDPRFGRYPVYEAASDDAIFLGADGRVQWEFVRNLVADATLSYVRATRLDESMPLPAIPPLNGDLRLRYETRTLFAHAGVTAAAGQNRVPTIRTPGGDLVQPEAPTDGYGLMHAGAGYRFDRGGLFHTVSLQANNLTNEVWRDHLSRIKEVAPQPGRNVQFTYRVQF